MHFRFKDTHRLNTKGLKKILHANGDREKAGVATLTSGKIGFKTRLSEETKMGII